jgi:LysM repeat protein
MARRLWLGALGWAAWAAAPLGAQTNTDLINLREDMNGLSQRLSELSLRVEQLEANQTAASRTVKAPADAVTAAQLEAAVADLNAQLERLRNAAAAGAAVPHSSVTVTATDSAAPTPAPAKKETIFAANFSKQGIMYTVQKGDTVASIAKKTGAKFQDIVNANKLTDPSKIYPGQQLAVPGGK